MKILFLGTGAADWNENAKTENGFFRRNSSVLVDECILIDPGPGVPDAIREYGVDVSKIKYVLNTHNHMDHFNQDTLNFLTDAGAEFFEVENPGEFTLGSYNVKAVRGNHIVPLLLSPLYS